MSRFTASARLLATLALSSLLATPALAQEDIRVRQLEGEVQRLQRELATQARRIDQLERDMRLSGTTTRAAAGSSRPADSSPAWLVVGNWDRIRTGMKELDVISILGRPTSARQDEAGKASTFFYALELGPNAVLVGSLKFDQAGVAEVKRPGLR